MPSTESDSEFDSFDGGVDLDTLFTAGKSKENRSIPMDNVIGRGGDKNKVFR